MYCLHQTTKTSLDHFPESLNLKRCVKRRELTFAGSDVVKVQFVALLGSVQGALGGEEVAGGVVGLVVSATNLQRNKPTDELSAF